MLKPEPMRRALIVTPREDASRLIEAIHALKAVHLIEHHKGEDELDIGRPLPTGSKASERLVRLRGLLRHLDAEAHLPSRSFRVADVEARLDALLDRLEREVGDTVASLSHADSERGAKESEKARIEPLSALPLRLEDYAPYATLRVFCGTVEGDAAASIRAAVAESETFQEGSVLAAFVPKDQAEAAQNALFPHAFKEIEVPPGEGLPSDRARHLDAEIATLQAQAGEARARLARLRTEYADFLRASEEHLAIAVEKAEAPLGFGATDHAFVLEAWVPEGDSVRLIESLNVAVRDRYHLEWLPTGEGHGPGAQVEMHGADQAEHAPEKAEEVPPTKYRNARPARPFEFFTSMFSVPRYGEIDPTLILAIAFPIFFGFMIGDFGLGLVMLGLGVLMARKLKRIEGMPQLGTAIAVAGAVAMVTGGIVFYDAFGIPIDVNHHMEDKLAAKGMAFACTPAVYEVVHETTWSCLLTGHSWHIWEPLILKTFDVPVMLLISLLAGLTHLALGLVFGIVNEFHHSKKHAAAKVGWLILLAGFFVASLWLLQKETLGGFADSALMFTGITTVVALIILVVTEGGLAVLEIPSMFSNILSYLRLGAVAIAKGAMAIAFNGLTLLAAIEGWSEGHTLIAILGAIGFLVAQMVLFVLGVLSSGIQAIRLNYVEFFTKFYKGGGQAFRPFGQPRQFTSET